MKTAAELYELGQRDLHALVAYTISLQERAALNSRNSGKPPVTDGYAKPAPKSLRGNSGKKTGGQPGHTGATLKPVEIPDKTEIHPLSKCPCGCGCDLSGQPPLGYESRQVFDLPPQKLIVTEHRVEIKRCPLSGELVHAPWPTGVTAPVQYGPDFLAWLVYLNTQQFIPLARIDQISFDLFGQHVSQDTILNAIRTVGQELTPFSAAIEELILLEPVVGADETGLRVNNKLHWLHILCTADFTWYGVHQKRGREALDSFGILPEYEGRLVHDCWQTYLELNCMHALCNAHILRELVFIHEQCNQEWAKSLFELLLEMNNERNEHKLVASCFPKERMLQWHQQYKAILVLGRDMNPQILPPADAPKKRGRKKQTKAQNLLDRLEQHEDWVLAFLHDFEVPFTNNQSEQDARMMKVKQKVSGCFRTFEGAETFATIRSYIKTLRKQGQQIFQGLKSAIQGNPFIPQATQSG